MAWQSPRQSGGEGMSTWQWRNRLFAAEEISLHTFGEQIAHFFFGWWKRFRRNGKENGENGAAPRAITAGNFAFVLLDDAVAGAQAQACSLSHGFGGVKGFEN